MPVDAVKPVALLKPLGALVGTALDKARQHRHAEGLRVGVEARDDDKAQHEVHKRTGRKDYHALPRGLIRKRARVFRLLVLPGHGAEAAEGDAAQGIGRLALLLFEYGGAHADRELLHAHSAGLCSREVAKLVDDDEHAEDKDRYEDVDNSHFE